MNETPTIAERVAAGIRALDEFGPEDWRERLNLERLDIGHPNLCVVGQLDASFDEHWSGYDILMGGHDEDAWRLGLIWSQPHSGVNIADETKLLNEEWRIQLAAAGVT